tara:strand:+ start:2346 stop:2507 length:162 start_codon:yes stop_codon:yes gene_type:complete
MVKPISKFKIAAKRIKELQLNYDYTAANYPWWQRLVIAAFFPNPFTFTKPFKE